MALAYRRDPLLAPQATLMASVSKGLFGRQLPWGMIECGAAIGAAIIALDEYLKASGAKWCTPVLAAAVGIYLPLDLTTPIFLGGLLTWFVERRLGVVKDDQDAKDRVHRKGVLFSAGLITGEALIGIFMAIPIVASGKADVLALPASLHLGQWAGLVMLGVIAWLLYRTAVKQTP
jgi:putative OPT family oligopeptide transporter